MSLKTNLPRSFCSPLDIISFITELATDRIDVSEQPISRIVSYFGMLQNIIIKVDATIMGALRPIYGNDTTTASPYRTTTPWCTAPFPQFGGYPEADNTGNGLLLSVQANYQSNSPGYTSGWKVEFSDGDTYTLYSFREGAQGGGNTNESVTSTNGDITIASDFWEAGDTPFAEGDKFYWSFVDTYPLLWGLSRDLATSKILQSIFAGQFGQLSEFANNLYTDSMRILRRLQKPDGEDGLSLESLPSLDLEPVQIDYPVNEWGEVVSSRTMTDNTQSYSA